MRINCDNFTNKIKIDVKDKKILDILSENSRMPISQIAKKVELSRDIVSYRIQRFEKLGVIQTFYPKINFTKLGFNTYHVFMALDESKNIHEFLEHIKNMPSTLFVFEYSDRWDIELVLIAKNIRELDQIVTCLQAEYSQVIMERTELLEITTYQSILFSYYFNNNIKYGNINKNIKNNQNNSSNNIKNNHKEKQEYKVDNLDIQILKMLCQNARLSTYEIAKEVSLSADAIGIRIKNLVKTGVIKKFSILANLSLLGYNWHTFCIKMRIFDENDEKKFRDFIENHPGILRAAKTFGNWDILMYIVSTDSKEFHTLIKDIKMNFPKIINYYSAFVAYKEHTFKAMPEVILE